MASVICKYCHTTNVVPDAAKATAVFKCGACGERLMRSAFVSAVVEAEPVQSQASASIPLNRPPHPAPRAHAHDDRADGPDEISRKIAELSKSGKLAGPGLKAPTWHAWFKGAFALVIGCALLATYLAPGSRSSAPRPTQRLQPEVPAPTSGTPFFTPSQPAAAPPLPPRVHQSGGLMRDYTGGAALAPLTVKTASGLDYYLKLVDAATGRVRQTYYIQGGVPLEVLIPLGTYRMRYASGEVWRGEEALFGPGSLTSYAEAKEVFDFLETADGYSGYTVELIMQSHGNLRTTSIPASAF